MRSLLVITASLFVINSVSAGTRYTCFTRAHEDYYVKKTLKFEILDDQTVFAQPYDAESQTWFQGSEGKKKGRNAKTGWIRFSGFDSTDMFGELSEGQADKGITIYISPEVISGRNGAISLYARGTEVGVQQASYFCKR